MPARKRYAKLKRADFAAAPIWQWADEENSASQEHTEDNDPHVEPTTYVQVPLEHFGQFVVACEVELLDGTVLPGIAEVTVVDSKAAVVLNEVFMIDRHLRVPAVETNRLLTRYTKKQTHPVAWRLSVLIEGESEPRSGKISGGDMVDVVRAGIEILESLKSLRK